MRNKVDFDHQELITQLSCQLPFYQCNYTRMHPLMINVDNVKSVYCICTISIIIHVEIIKNKNQKSNTSTAPMQKNTMRTQINQDDIKK